MATATQVCTLNTSSYYYGGWNPAVSVGSEASFAGGVSNPAYYVMKFTVPSLSGSFTSSSFKITLPINRLSTTMEYSTLRWGISTSDHGSGTTLPTMLWQGSQYVSNLNYNAQVFTFTSSNFSLSTASSYSGPLYLWVWAQDVPGGNIVELSSGASYYSVTLTYDAAAVLGQNGAPTTVTVSPATVNPGNSVKISWSGATKGSNNQIMGWRIYYRQGSLPTSSTYTGAFDYNVGTSNATSGNTNFTMPSGSTPGATYYFKVMAYGNTGETNSALSSAYGSTEIAQSPPVISSFTASPSIFGPAQQPVVTTFYFSVSSPSGSTVYKEVYDSGGRKLWPTSGSSTASSCTLTLDSQAFPESSYSTQRNHWFYLIATDTYGNQSQASTIVSRAGASSITSLEINAVNSPSYRTLTDNNTLPFCTIVSGVATASGTAISYRWLIRASTTLSGLASAPSVGLASTTSPVLSQWNVSEHVPFGYYYQIGCKVDNGAAYGAEFWKTSGYTSGGRTSTAFYMAPAVAPLNISNKTSAITSFNPSLSTYPNTNPKDFSQEIAITHTYNSLYTVRYGYKLSSSTSPTVTWVGDSTVGAYGTNMLFPMSTSAYDVATRTPMNICVVTTYGANYSAATGNDFIMTKIITYPLSNTNVTSGISGMSKPIHTNIESLYASAFTQFWGASDLNTYYDMPTDWTNFSLHLSVNNGTSLIHQGGPNNVPGSLNPDTRTWQYYGGQLYDWSTNPLNLTYGTDYAASIQLQVTDYFGNIHTANSSSFTLSLKETPVFDSTASSKLAIRYNRGDGLVSVVKNNPAIVNEGYKLQFDTPTAKTYADVSISYRLYICRSDTPLDNLSGGTYTLYTSIPATPIQDTILTFDYTILQITAPRYCYFRVDAIDTGGQAASLYYNDYELHSGKLQVIDPQYLTISNGQIDAATRTQLSFNYLLSNAGGGLVGINNSYWNFDSSNMQFLVQSQYSFDGQNYTTYETDLFNETATAAMGTVISPNIRSTTLSVLEVTAPFIYMRLKVTAKVYTAESDILLPTYTSYSNVMVIPNVQPTVAYRKGYLGINNTDFEDDDVLVVNIGAGGRDQIRLISADWRGSINLIDGSIDGFIIDGGSWI